MKFTATLLALAACSATAFTGSHTAFKPSTALFSTEPETSGIELAAFGPFNQQELRRVQGTSRTTIEFNDPSQEVAQVYMASEGRPIKADCQVWIGPDWTPMKLSVYSEDGKLRPVQTLVGTRFQNANIDVNNSGNSAFPLMAGGKYASLDQVKTRAEILGSGLSRYIEGGAIYSKAITGSSTKVLVVLHTDTRQLNAKVELLCGPNNIKQEYEIFTNNGELNSLYILFNTPDFGTTVRVKNLAPHEFPCKAYIVPQE
uniref:Uncharacterized protein n=1 Tax=Eucampia antarctica TaxID=49252 RepID=A0A7S2WE04_9STRA|mmetsp:Transcript_27740/g.26554  ORF Transcript_27740/g.26554 Transcript_27740/m.26554 type:complete len:258 (+) Transcript_27740:67-840(+)|eukprot:CAMPEP_0197823288 /NCGR_PEP_ID=MMETSP1437-20131217/601_1 /TAXON_ID=49252 ORGANISM="Eucampia antarctica, Strain CCMP1452" /NCGR_SAMPLE_ID=MMETSP1437 /ASSEMBLY_ACC=CAM_ASM_001096 /LENGTH=257 /DNA_ID=CAMNT_0043422363 /DNA_START=59 /DNA_END=832 /DNA_ORIENTATION=-